MEKHLQQVQLRQDFNESRGLEVLCQKYREVEFGN